MRSNHLYQVSGVCSCIKSIWKCKSPTQTPSPTRAVAQRESQAFQRSAPQESAHWVQLEVLMPVMQPFWLHLTVTTLPPRSGHLPGYCQSLPGLTALLYHQVLGNTSKHLTNPKFIFRTHHELKIKVISAFFQSKNLETENYKILLWDKNGRRV